MLNMLYFCASFRKKRSVIVDEIGVSKFIGRTVSRGMWSRPKALLLNPIPRDIRSGPIIHIRKKEGKRRRIRIRDVELRRFAVLLFFLYTPAGAVEILSAFGMLGTLSARNRALAVRRRKLVELASAQASTLG